MKSFRPAGLFLLGLVSLGDVSALVLTDGQTPPYPVAALLSVLGLVSLVLVVRALQDPGRPVRLLLGLRLLSALAAVPALLLDDVPAAAQAAAVAAVLLTVMGALLIGTTRRPVTA